MRVQRILVNETCNQECGFCNARRGSERPDFIAVDAVVARIAAAKLGGAQELVLTGGEPTLRHDLAEVVKVASDGGTRVVLETNGRRVDAPYAELLAEAGLAAARVALADWGAHASEAITGDAGGFEAAVAAIQALADCGVEVEISVPVVRRNAARVAALVGDIAVAGLPITGIALVVPLDSPRRDELASLATATEAVAAVADVGRRYGVPIRLESGTFIPPCLFPAPERVAHLFALNRGNASRRGYVHVAGCVECLVRDRCPGIPEATSLPAVAAIRDDRLRRRLTVTTSVQDQIRRELVSRDLQHGGGEQPLVEHTVRINFHCNQACEFCFVSTHLPPAAESAVRDAIVEAGRAGAVVVLSGGEPTLNPRLREYIELARSAGAFEVELQTNAIRLADTALTASLISAGLDRVMVSLHGSRADISDAVTRAPGTFERTVKGIDALVAHSIRVRLNFVFCRENFDDFPALVEFVGDRWPNVAIVFSFVGSHTDVVPRTTALLPRFSEILPALRDGLSRAARRNVPVFGFDSMCGLPLCLLPDSHRAAYFRTSAQDAGGEFVKGAECVGCAERERCFGIRRGYAELYGTAELQPFAAPIDAPTVVD